MQQTSEKWFNAKKAAQVAVFFVNKEGKKMNALKLVKLIYLANREHMRQRGYPIFNDKLVSMKFGPVNSLALDHINGFIESEGWKKFMGERQGNNVVAHSMFKPDDLLELSKAEIQSMEKVWQEFGQETKWDLSDWTHEKCPEWEDPRGGSVPIPYERVLQCLGVADPHRCAENIREDRRIAEFFAGES